MHFLYGVVVKFSNEKITYRNCFVRNHSEHGDTGHCSIQRLVYEIFVIRKILEGKLLFEYLVELGCDAVQRNTLQT